MDIRKTPIYSPTKSYTCIIRKAAPPINQYVSASYGLIIAYLFLDKLITALTTEE